MTVLEENGSKVVTVLLDYDLLSYIFKVILTPAFAVYINFRSFPARLYIERERFPANIW